jgi:hypothetical protein
VSGTGFRTRARRAVTDSGLNATVGAATRHLMAQRVEAFDELTNLSLIHISEPTRPY